jgi:hypothetical protein
VLVVSVHHNRNPDNSALSFEFGSTIVRHYNPNKTWGPGRTLQIQEIAQCCLIRLGLMVCILPLQHGLGKVGHNLLLGRLCFRDSSRAPFAHFFIPGVCVLKPASVCNSLSHHPLHVPGQRFSSHRNPQMIYRCVQFAAYSYENIVGFTVTHSVAIGETQDDTV